MYLHSERSWWTPGYRIWRWLVWGNIFRDFIMLTRNFNFVVVTKVPRQLLVYAHKLVKVPINIYVCLYTKINGDPFFSFFFDSTKILFKI